MLKELKLLEVLGLLEMLGLLERLEVLGLLEVLRLLEVLEAIGLLEVLRMLEVLGLLEVQREQTLYFYPASLQLPYYALRLWNGLEKQNLVTHQSQAHADEHYSETA